MKKADVTLKEYVKKLSDDSLYFLNIRLSQAMCGDRADIADFLSQDRGLDNWLQSATTAEEWFDMVDLVGEFVRKEVNRRGTSER
jgi:hypothetical protein